ncbi:site-specific integrase [Microvirga arabica]|uniref:site-specific integrase n=1 Tax=Microvirga arabica TaxID=1128671 RepID=UPI00193A4D17|nr:site-specific integrase [Microvirga arabica]MBM1170354.1 site-specific integrase [Microvirga arabica]
MATIRKLRGRWQAAVRRKGMKPRAKSFDTKAEAERWARELEAEVDRFGRASDTRPAENITLGALLRRYRDEVSPTKRGALQEIQRIDVLVRHDICHRTLAGLSSADIASYRDERMKKVASSTVVRELAIISHAIEVAQREWGYHLAFNPVKRVRRPIVANARSRRLEGEEEQRLLDACETGRTPCLKSLLIVAIETGMRRGELLSITWADVDLNARIVHLTRTKNGESRDVPLSSRAIKAIQALRSTNTLSTERLFPLTPGALEQAWTRLKARANVAGLRLHDLRHEAVSRLFEKGLSTIEVSAISGHKELRMLSRYTHLRATDLATRLN